MFEWPETLGKTKKTKKTKKTINFQTTRDLGGGWSQSQKCRFFWFFWFFWFSRGFCCFLMVIAPQIQVLVSFCGFWCSLQDILVFDSQKRSEKPKKPKKPKKPSISRLLGIWGEDGHSLKNVGFFGFFGFFGFLEDFGVLLGFYCSHQAFGVFLSFLLLFLGFCSFSYFFVFSLSFLEGCRRPILQTVRFTKNVKKADSTCSQHMKAIVTPKGVLRLARCNASATREGP